VAGIRIRALIAVAVAAAATVATVAVAVAPATAARAPACPGTDRPAAVSGRAGSARSLVPGTPDTVLLCRYGGANDGGAAFRLLASPHLVTSRATTARLARDLDALTPTTGVVFHCPLDTGDAIVAYFRYPSGADDPVTAGLDGCMLVTNGHVHRTAGVQPTGRRVIAALAALVPPQRSSALARSGTSCPPSARTTPVSARPGSRRTLVPGAPRTLLLCRYSGLAQPPAGQSTGFRLVGSRRLTDVATVARVAREIDALRRFPRTPIACPAGDGSAVIALFGYRSGPDDPVTVRNEGCWSASDGHLARNAESVAGVALVDQLRALVPLPL
jgi:hypothetical protein